MNEQTSKFSRWIVFTAAMLAVPSLVARADTLVLTDGRWLTGTVTETETGYTITNAQGSTDVIKDTVTRWLKDHKTATPVTVTPPATATTGGGAAPAAVAVSPDALLAQGQAALSAGDLPAAQKAFTDALTQQPNSFPAARGLAAVCMGLSLPEKAARYLELAASLATTPDRAVVLDAAAFDLRAHSPMKGVRLIKAYLEKASLKSDEAVLNALAISLCQADNSARRMALFREASDLYVQYNTELESTRPGEKRWGIEWMQANVVDDRMRERQQVQNEADRISQSIGGLSRQINQLQADRAAVANSPWPVVDLGARLADYDRATANLADQRSRLQQQYNDQMASMPRIDFPKEIPLVPLVEGNATVVSAAPVDPLPEGTAIHTVPVDPNSRGRFHPAPQTETPPPAPREPLNLTGGGGSSEHAKPATPRLAEDTQRTAVAFPIAPNLLVTAASAVANARKIDIDAGDGTTLHARVVRTDAATGLALLQLQSGKLSPLVLGEAFTDDPVVCAGFPTMDFFNPTPETMPVTAGAPAPGWKVHFTKNPRIPGGPLIQKGAVVGVEMGNTDLNAGQTPAVTLQDLKAFAGADANPGPEPAQEPTGAVVQITASKN